MRLEFFETDKHISTHTPHARRDKQESAKLLTYRTFQLTRLMRGVTPDGHPFNIMPLFQLTRLMRGVTRLTFDAQIINNISTHTPHARRDNTGGR